ncbi:MAG TPA: hypothetical protein GX747_02400, partial [Tenericutes bacterium]|nr:hypothetical protein [Mycoplasmatota bacterium]
IFIAPELKLVVKNAFRKNNYVKKVIRRNINKRKGIENEKIKFFINPILNIAGKYVFSKNEHVKKVIYNIEDMGKEMENEKIVNTRNR